METPANGAEVSPLPPSEPKARMLELLDEFRQRAVDGKLANIAIAFTAVSGAADVYSSPMSPVSMNHLLKLFERRVDSAYDRALRASDAARSPGTQPMKANSPKPVIDTLPRAARRVVKNAQRKVARHQEKIAKKRQAAVSAIANPTPGKVS